MENLFAYVDDLAVGVDSMEELTKVTDAIKRWSRKHGVAVNHRKSGILQFGRAKNTNRPLDPAKGSHHLGYPVVNEYKYLSIVIDYRLRLDVQLDKVKNTTNLISWNLRILGRRNFTVTT